MNLRFGAAPLAPVLLCILLAAALSPGNAWSQAGTVVSYTTIDNATMAALGTPLDNGDEFGDAVANLGDLDGPGPSVDALAVGAISDDDGGSHRGAVYILFLDPVGSVLSSQKISSTQGNFTGLLDFGDEFGGALAWLGDLDGAGPSAGALAVGTINDDDGGINRGAVYILFLNRAGRVLSHQKISSLAGNFTAALADSDEFGGAVASLGDLDGAGPSAGAIAVGAVYDDDGGADRGALYVLFLNSAGSVLSYRKISSTQGGFLGQLGDDDQFAEDICPLGDLDGPGPAAIAIAVGAVGDDDGGSAHGAVYIMFLNSAGVLLQRQKISDTQGNFGAVLMDDDDFGGAVSCLGDLDQAGPSAVAIAAGAGSDDGAGLDRGATYILFLNASGVVMSWQEISSTSSIFAGQLHDADEFGSGLASLGDLSGNGGLSQTLACGLSLWDAGGPDRGAVSLLTLAGNVQVGVGEAPNDARAPGLGPARPNVFAERTSIPFRLREAGRVTIDVWDAGGRRVRRLLDRSFGPGEHRTDWDGDDDAGRPARSGAYFLRMSVNGQALAGSTKALLLR